MSESRPQQTKRPAPRTAFKPGQSGNPGGRPKVVAEIRELAQLEGPASIAALVRLRDGAKTPPAVKAVAAQAILDRGYGKPTQPLENAGDKPLMTVVIEG